MSAVVLIFIGLYYATNFTALYALRMRWRFAILFKWINYGIIASLSVIGLFIGIKSLIEPESGVEGISRVPGYYLTPVVLITLISLFARIPLWVTALKKQRQFEDEQRKISVEDKAV